MTASGQPLSELQASLGRILEAGLEEDPIQHARQVAEIASILHAAFAGSGFVVTLVGGSAIEIHAPGIYRSGDLDVVVERVRQDTAHRDHVFEGLGFIREGRHWRRGQDLFVEVVVGPVSGPTEDVRAGDSSFRVVKKEVVLRDRLVGFKHWKHTAYGQQAIDMLAAFGDELELSWLEGELKREDSLDALHALQLVANSSQPVTEQSLRAVIEQLHRRDPGH